jgi:Leucine-rich repeat (LRR) protein
MAESNQISVLKTFPKLVSINIANNKLVSIDSQPNLKNLVANNNQISSIGNLPEIQVIDISKNLLTEFIIPNNSTHVSLHFNPITNISMNESILSKIQELQINYATYKNIYSKYYSNFHYVEMVVCREKLKELLKKINKIFDEELIEMIFQKLIKLEFQKRDETFLKISLRLFCKLFPINEFNKVSDILESENFKILFSNIEKIYYKTLIVTLYFNGYY